MSFIRVNNMSDFLIALLCFIFLFTVHCVWFYLVFICVLRSCNVFVFLMLITKVCKSIECKTEMLNCLIRGK